MKYPAGRLATQWHLVGLAFTVAVFVQPAQSAPAQPLQEIEWSKPQRLSGLTAEATEATMVADSRGYVHALWIEYEPEGERSTIQYAEFNGSEWTIPNDIYVSPFGNRVRGLSAFVDDWDQLHIAWIEGNSGPLFYSVAQIGDAASARNWSLPMRLDLPALYAELAVDSAGNVHLAYANFYGDEEYEEATGIYHVQSTDRGVSWSAPIQIDSTIGFWYRWRRKSSRGVVIH